MTLRAALTVPALLSLGACAHHPDHHGPGAHAGHGHEGHGQHVNSHNPADLEAYLARLEGPEREAWQRPDAVLTQLALTGSEVVADVGAGGGYFTLRFARALPKGRVVALDVEPRMVEHLQARLTKEAVTNVQATLTKFDDPGTPPEADLVFICNVLHHVDAAVREQWFARLAQNLKPGARLALLEFKQGIEVGPPDDEKIPREGLLALAQRHGLTLVGDHPEVVPNQHFLVFSKP